MINRRLIIKYFAILAVLFMPKMAFAQGAVVSYAFGKGQNLNSNNLANFPSVAQLERLTHVIASDIGVEAVSNLYNGLWVRQLPNIWEGGISLQGVWNGTTKNLWLVELVKNAHAEGVKAIICVGGGGAHWVHATSSTNNNLNKFVADIVKFVTDHKFDGVDINWEHPETQTEWQQCFNLLNALKLALPCKRISIALQVKHPNTYPDALTPPNHRISRLIWEKVDAINLMTYDQGPDGPEGWQTHSDAGEAITHINNWAFWGNSNGFNNLDSRRKLFLGSAFYGCNYKRDKNGNYELNQYGHRILDTDNPVSYASGGSCENPGDNTTSVVSKVNYCYSNQQYGGFGGVFVWELGYDLPATNSNSLLNAIWQRNNLPYNNGYLDLEITTHPAASTIVVQGSISGSLLVVANKPCTEVIYQWYSNTINSNSGGTLIPGATNESFPIPANLTAGTYYYYCKLSGKNSVTSDVATVVVSLPPSISGSTLLCSGTNYNFSVANEPSGFYWGKSSSKITISNTTGNPITVSATGNGPGWVSINDSYGVEYARCNFWIGPPVPSLTYASLGFEYGILPMTLVIVHLNDIEDPIAPLQAVYKTDWSVTPSAAALFNPDIWGTGFKTVKLLMNAPDIYGELKAKSYNTCGNGTGYLYFVVTNQLSPSSAPPSNNQYKSYPNPVSNFLNIEIDATIAQGTTYDIRLYDKQGNLMRQKKTKGGTVQFNVANLPNGIYYLHIYDGVSETPEMRQIVVEH